MRTNFFAIKNQTIDVDLVLLLIRLISGAVFIFAGWGKIQNPFNWMGNQDVFPGFMQALAALAELGGGILLLLGFLTRLGSLAIFFTMIGAIYFHKIVLGDPFINPTGGSSYQPAVLYLLLSLVTLVMGAGRLSLDWRFFGIRR